MYNSINYFSWRIWTQKQKKFCRHLFAHFRIDQKINNFDSFDTLFFTHIKTASHCSLTAKRLVELQALKLERERHKKFIIKNAGLINLFLWHIACHRQKEKKIMNNISFIFFKKKNETKHSMALKICYVHFFSNLDLLSLLCIYIQKAQNNKNYLISHDKYSSLYRQLYYWLRTQGYLDMNLKSTKVIRVRRNYL